MRLEHECVAQKVNGRVTEFMAVTEAMKFESVVNLKTAKLIGVSVDPNLLARANRIIK